MHTCTLLFNIDIAHKQGLRPIHLKTLAINELLIITVGLYIVLSHVHYMLKVLHTLLLQQFCVVLHIYSFSISTLKYKGTMAMDYTWSGLLKCMAR